MTIECLLLIDKRIIHSYMKIEYRFFHIFFHNYLGVTYIFDQNPRS